MKFIITKHAMERYSERVNFNHNSVRKAILKDLKALKHKRIITIGDKKHVFFKNYREFILKVDGEKEILVTVIKHRKDKKEEAIRKRQQEKEEYKQIINDFTIDKENN